MSQHERRAGNCRPSSHGSGSPADQPAAPLPAGEGLGVGANQGLSPGGGAGGGTHRLRPKRACGRAAEASSIRRSPSARLSDHSIGAVMWDRPDRPKARPSTGTQLPLPPGRGGGQPTPPLGGLRGGGPNRCFPLGGDSRGGRPAKQVGVGQRPTARIAGLTSWPVSAKGRSPGRPACGAGRQSASAAPDRVRRSTFAGAGPPPARRPSGRHQARGFAGSHDGSVRRRAVPAPAGPGRLVDCCAQAKAQAVPAPTGGASASPRPSAGAVPAPAGPGRLVDCCAQARWPDGRMARSPHAARLPTASTRPSRTSSRSPSCRRTTSRSASPGASARPTPRRRRGRGGCPGGQGASVCPLSLTPQQYSVPDDRRAQAWS